MSSKYQKKSHQYLEISLFVKRKKGSMLYPVV